ncbi:hypothetical protein C0989_000548 [Termitomyces sp. Mn162]|nr:hypothetical protein C0989_000548 [Termitomyces sp. Mn162]
MSTPLTFLRTNHTILHPEHASPFENDVHEHELTRRKNVMDVEERRRQLEDDPWALKVLPKLVKCGGCLRWIKLDQRSMYYSGLWKKHRELCRSIKQIKGEHIPKRMRRATGNVKIAKSGKEVRTLRSTRVPKKDPNGQGASIFEPHGAFSRDPSLGAEEPIRDVTQFELPDTSAQRNLPRNLCQPLIFESDDDTDLMTPRSTPSILLEETDAHLRPGSCKWPWKVDREASQIRYQGRPDYYYDNQKDPGPVPDTFVAVAKAKLKRYQSIIGMAPNEGAYTNPDEMGHYQTHKTSLRNAINHRFAKTFVKDPATRPQVGLVGPGLPLRCHQHSVLRADNIPPPLLAHPTAHGEPLYSTGYSESESENDVEEGTFAPGEIIRIILKHG